jgi:hypothetical protein
MDQESSASVAEAFGSVAILQSRRDRWPDALSGLFGLRSIQWRQFEPEVILLAVGVGRRHSGDQCEHRSQHYGRVAGAISPSAGNDVDF